MKGVLLISFCMSAGFLCLAIMFREPYALVPAVLCYVFGQVITDKPNKDE